MNLCHFNLFNILPNEMIYEIFNHLPIYNLPLCDKKLKELIYQYHPYLVFRNHLQSMDAGLIISHIIHQRKLVTLGIKSTPIVNHINNLMTVHNGEKHSLIWCKDIVYGSGLNHLSQLGSNYSSDLLLLEFDSFDMADLQIKTDDLLGIVCGDNHNIFIKKDGLYGLGYNKFGQLGNLELERVKVLTKIDFPYIAEKVACGSEHTIIMTKNKVFGLGSNTCGQLNGPCNTHKNNITLLYESDDLIDVSCGAFSTFIVTKQGVYACGSNINSELGVGWQNTVSTLTKISDIDNVKKVKNGSYFSVFLSHNLSNNELYACGDNYYGQLATSEYLNVKSPKRLNISNIDNFVCGDNHMIVKSNNQYYGCGWNRYNQLGLGNSKNKKYNNFKLIKF